MMMPFEWDVRVSSKDHTVAALYVVNDELATVGYTTLGGTTPQSPVDDVGELDVLDLLRGQGMERDESESAWVSFRS